MFVKYERPHQGGAMAGIGKDIKIEELPDVTNDLPTPVPAGGSVVTGDNIAAQDWKWDRTGKFGRTQGGS